jgi:hypothetical protein
MTGFDPSETLAAKSAVMHNAATAWLRFAATYEQLRSLSHDAALDFAEWL